MAKKTKRPISKDGFVMYAKDVDACIEELSYEERGQLLTVVSQFVNGREVEQHPRVVKMAFNIIKKGILANEEKYLKRQETLKEYYDRKNAENAKNAEIVKNLPSNGNSNGNGDGIGNGIGYGNGIGNSNGNGDGNGENNNNSLSVENYKTYSKNEVKAILEEREIFFKQNFFNEFYAANESTFHWKYDPYTAALIFIRRHPEAIKKGEKTENAPQDPAAPPVDAVTSYDAILKKTAETWWAEMQDTFAQRIPADKMPLLAKITPVSAHNYGYSLREIVLHVPDLDTYNFARLTLETILKDFRFTRIDYKMPDDVKAAVEAEMKVAREAHFKRRGVKVA